MVYQVFSKVYNICFTCCCYCCPHYAYEEDWNQYTPEESTIYTCGRILFKPILPNYLSTVYSALIFLFVSKTTHCIWIKRIIALQNNANLQKIQVHRVSILISQITRVWICGNNSLTTQKKRRFDQKQKRNLWTQFYVHIHSEQLRI